MSSFLENGPEIYAKALREEYYAAMERLKTRLRECATLIERLAIEGEMKTLKKEYKDRLEGMGRSLF